MIKTITLAAAAALTLASLPASAHERASRAPAAGQENFEAGSGRCVHAASGLNMDKVERTFRSMPQSTRMNLQHMLRHAGLYAGADDGIWGRGTDCAMRAVVGRFNGTMRDVDVIRFFEYMLDGGFIADDPGTLNPFPHPGMLY